MSAAPASFAFTKLAVPDLDRAEAFYGTVFGLVPIHRVTAADHAYPLEEVILSQSGAAPGSGHALILLRYLDRPCPPAGAAWTGFMVADLAATCTAAQAAGGRIAVPIHDNPEHAVRAALIEDPFGHIIEAIEPMPA